MVMQVIMDPLTSEAQQLLPVLLHLRDTAQVNVHMLLTPALETDTMPLQAYYAYASAPPPIAACGHKSDSSGAATSGDVAVAARAHFAKLPEDRVLTMSIDVPEGWLVEVLRSPHHGVQSMMLS